MVQVDALVARLNRVSLDLGMPSTTTIDSAAIREAVAVMTTLAEEVNGIQRALDLRWDADRRAIKRWQAETGRDLTWPDHADLVVWLLEKLDAAAKATADRRR